MTSLPSSSRFLTSYQTQKYFFYKALATIKGPPKDAQNFRQMIGALTMKQTPQHIPPEQQIDPAVQKNRLIIQMRNNLRQKYQVLYYIKECRELLLKLEREIFQLGSDTYFDKVELDELSRTFPTFQPGLLI